MHNFDSFPFYGPFLHAVLDFLLINIRIRRLVYACQNANIELTVGLLKKQNANFGCEAKTSSWPYSTLVIYPYRFSVNPWHLNSWYCIHMMGANHNLEEIKKCNAITVQIWVSSVQISNPNYFAQTQWCMCLTTLVVEIDKKCCN